MLWLFGDNISLKINTISKYLQQKGLIDEYISSHHKCPYSTNELTQPMSTSLQCPRHSNVLTPPMSSTLQWSHSTNVIIVRGKICQGGGLSGWIFVRAKSNETISIVHNLLGLVGKWKSKKYCLKMQLQVLKSVLQRCISKFINLSESSYHVLPL